MTTFKNYIVNELHNILKENLNISEPSPAYDKFSDCVYVKINDNTQKELIAFGRSIKIANIRFDIKSAQNFLIENALALGMSWESLSPWKIILLIVCDLIKFTTAMTIKLSDKMIDITTHLAKLNAYKGIEKDKFYSILATVYAPNQLDEILGDLKKIKIVEIRDNTIFLLEKIWFTRKEPL